MATKTKSRTRVGGEACRGRTGKNEASLPRRRLRLHLPRLHALPPLSRPDGTPVGAVLGFTNMLVKLLAENATATTSPSSSMPGGAASAMTSMPTTRRTGPPPPDDLIPQFALVREATRAFNVPAIELPGFEADDLIATYAEARAMRAPR